MLRIYGQCKWSVAEMRCNGQDSVVGLHNSVEVDMQLPGLIFATVFQANHSVQQTRLPSSATNAFVHISE